MFSLATPLLGSHSQPGVEQFEGIVDFLERSLSAETAVHEVERGLWTRLLALGHAMLGGFFAASGDGDAGERLWLEDGREIKRLAARARPYRSIFGDFQLRRVVYGAREGQAIEAIPLDARLKLPAACTSYLLQDWNEQLMVEMPYGQACGLLERLLGVRQSVQTLERQQQAMSSAVGPFWAQHPTPPSEGNGMILVNTLDCKGVAMRASETAGERGKKKMALLGSVYSIAPYPRIPEEVLAALFAEAQAPRKTLHPPRPKPLHKQVRACLARDGEDTTAPQTATVLEWIARHNAQRNPDGERPIVVLIDGQDSLWRAVQHAVPGDDVTEILDIIHVSSYLWEAANLLFEKDSGAARAWTKTHLGRILHGGVGAVIQQLRAPDRHLRGTAQKRLEGICTYLSNNAHRMAYDAYLAAGFPIATGVIEGACRHLVKDRMERSGMRWTMRGAQAMLALRSVILSQLWEPFIDCRIRSELTRLYGAKAVNDEPLDLPIAA
jgi:hypothetical protein